MQMQQSCLMHNARMLCSTAFALSAGTDNSSECSTYARRYRHLKKSKQGLQIEVAACARDSIPLPKLSATALLQHTDLLTSTALPTRRQQAELRRIHDVMPTS